MRAYIDLIRVMECQYMSFYDFWDICLMTDSTWTDDTGSRKKEMFKDCLRNSLKLVVLPENSAAIDDPTVAKY